MSPALQVKLLRVLQEGTFTPVGGTKPVKVDVRIVAASHKDLMAMVSRKEFREDLFYRVNVLKVVLPPLRDRVADIPVLAHHFLKKHWKSTPARTEPPVLHDGTIDAMVRYQWPGNIRELENEVERMLVLGGDGPSMGADLLSPRIRAGVEQPVARPAPPLTGTLREVMERIEAEVILQGLIRTHWNKSQLAKELGISRSYLIQKCTYYGLERKE
jgi:DNA-binding NtrC family response regulator